MVNKSEKIVFPGLNYPFISEPFFPPKKEHEKVEVKIDDSYNVERKVEEEGKKKKWLVIHYGAGDNNLADYIFSDTDELEKVGSDENTHVISILDVGKQWGVPFRGARIFYLKQDDQVGKINSPIVKNLGKVNMADPVFMANIIKEVISKFPAENIAIIIGDHGAGWQGAVEDDSAGGKFMKIGEIREALEEVSKSIGKKIDVLAFDACLMAMAEVGYELKNAVKYMVASEQLEGGGGYNYTILFSKAMANAIKNLQSASLLKIKVGPEEFAKIIVEAAKEYSYDIETISAVNLDKAVDLAKAINSFAETVLSKTTEAQAHENLNKFKNLLQELEKIKSQKPTMDYNKLAEVLKDYTELTKVMLKLSGNDTKNNNTLQNELENIEKLKQFDKLINELLLSYNVLNISKNLEELLSKLNTNDAKKIKEKIKEAEQFYGSFR
ncbi:MAG: clostripain-related cysteine peptidase, partial [bacterium]